MIYSALTGERCFKSHILDYLKRIVAYAAERICVRCRRVLRILLKLLLQCSQILCQHGAVVFKALAAFLFAAVSALVG